MDAQSSQLSLFNYSESGCNMPNFGMWSTGESLSSSWNLNYMQNFSEYQKCWQNLQSYLSMRNQFEVDFDRWYLMSNYCFCSEETHPKTDNQSLINTSEDPFQWGSDVVMNNSGTEDDKDLLNSKAMILKKDFINGPQLGKSELLFSKENVRHFDFLISLFCEMNKIKKDSSFLYGGLIIWNLRVNLYFMPYFKMG